MHTSYARRASPVSPTSRMLPTFSTEKPLFPPTRLTVPPSSSTDMRSGRPTSSSDIWLESESICLAWDSLCRFCAK